MNALEQFYIDLDKSDWDVKDESVIDQRLQEMRDVLPEETRRFAEIDRQVFHFSKSPEKFLSFRVAGTRTMKDGSEIPFEWPDINEFRDEDFDYLYNRFETTKNLYAKTEYGLVLLYSKKRQDNDFVIKLLNALFELFNIYIQKAKFNDGKNYYIIYSTTVLANALYIAHNRSNANEFKEIFETLIISTFEIHQDWDLTHHSTLRAIIDFTNILIKYHKDFSSAVKVDKIIEKNFEVAKILAKTDAWGGIYIIDATIPLCQKTGRDIKDLLYFYASQYERLSLERKDDLASLSFVEKAMSIYKKLKDRNNLQRLQSIYQHLRTELHLDEIWQAMPDNEVQRIIQTIKKELSEKGEEEILKILLLTPMIRPLSDIKKWSEESFKDKTFENIRPHFIKDKFGNTVAQFITDDEKSKHWLLRTYELHMQIATQTIVQFFIEAFRSNKISADSIISFLSQTWLGEKASRKINGRLINLNYIKLVESGILSFFEELLKWKTNPEYFPNLVSATDSLVLKAEYFLRVFCEILGITTFKEDSRKPGIIMEKLLDNLLDDLKGKISDDDHFFFKFVLTEKAGYNLRNKIAHGLMDDVEYGLEYSVLSIIIILKLSNYQFTPAKND
jgi:hypothetical protein